jgi:hypothetical protein
MESTGSGVSLSIGISGGNGYDLYLGLVLFGPFYSKDKIICQSFLFAPLYFVHKRDFLDYYAENCSLYVKYQEVV